MFITRKEFIRIINGERGYFNDEINKLKNTIKRKELEVQLKELKLDYDFMNSQYAGCVSIYKKDKVIKGFSLYYEHTFNYQLALKDMYNNIQMWIDDYKTILNIKK